MIRRITAGSAALQYEARTVGKDQLDTSATCPHSLSVIALLLDLLRPWNVTLSAVRMAARGTTCICWFGCCHCGHTIQYDTADGRDPKELHRGGEERART